MSFLNDTSVLSQVTKGKPEPASMAWLQRTDFDLMFLSVITLLELRIGVDGMDPGVKRTKLSNWLEQDLPATFKTGILPVTSRIADDAGRLLADSKAAGFSAEPTDALIAATARVYGYSVATLNRKHFQLLDVPLIDF